MRQFSYLGPQGQGDLMARIRTIKPEFFRHEALQDLELANPGMYPMMVFEALWGHCDSKGRFEWKPRMLKLDILPFLPFDMSDTLGILEKSGMLHRYSVDGKEYGVIETFEKHQRLSGKEVTEGEKYPEQQREEAVKQSGSVREIPESQEGKGKEREEEGKGVVVAPIEFIPENHVPIAIAPATEKPETVLQAVCRQTWAAYAYAYERRYGAAPVRNAKVSTQVKTFVQRIGHDESLSIAEWFVSHPGGYYVSRMHDFGCLLNDAEKLRTEWATGRVMTQGKARQSDRTGTTGAALAEVLAELGDAA